MTSPLIVPVCRGNIARSAFAEAIIKQELDRRGLSDKYQVVSRGVQGTPADPEPVKFPNLTHYGQFYEDAKPTLDEFGVDLSKHQSTKINEAVAKKAAILLAMDSKTKQGLQTLFPDQTHKIYLLTELVGKGGDITDPEGVSGKEAQRRIFTEIRDIILEGFDKLIALTSGG